MDRWQRIRLLPNLEQVLLTIKRIKFLSMALLPILLMNVMFLMRVYVLMPRIVLGKIKVLVFYRYGLWGYVGIWDGNIFLKDKIS